MVNEQQPSEQLDAKGATRRRFTRAGVAASGVLLTLHSQPGMAVQACTTPSGFQSLKFGGSHNPRVGECGGYSPGGWGQSMNKANNPLAKMKWWTQINPETTKFRDLFGYCGSGYYANLGTDAATLKAVLLDQGNNLDHNQLGAHMVASFLNNHFGLSPYPDKATLVKIWYDFINDGVYVPSAGVPGWDAEKIKFYLTNTWHGK